MKKKEEILKKKAKKDRKNTLIKLIVNLPSFNIKLNVIILFRHNILKSS